MKNLLIVEPGSRLKEFIIIGLIQAGHDVYVACDKSREWICDILPESRIIWTAPYSFEVLLTDVFRFSIENKVKFDGVGTFYEHAVFNAAVLAECLGVPAPALSGIIHSSLNKSAMRNTLLQHGLSRIRCQTVYGLPRLKSAVEKVDFPCVVKPYRGSDSFGVRLIRRIEDLAAYETQYRHECGREMELSFEALAACA